MTSEEIQAEILILPQPKVKTPEEQRLHEERKAENRRQLEEHLSALMAKKGIKPQEITRD